MPPAISTALLHTELTQNGVAYELKHAASAWTQLDPAELWQWKRRHGSIRSNGVRPERHPLWHSFPRWLRQRSRLQPAAAPRFAPPFTCPWQIRLLWTLLGAPMAASPAYGALNFDQSCNGYGTTQYGGTSNNGTVYQLTRQGQAVDRDSPL